MRLRADIWVSAYLRRCEIEGAVRRCVVAPPKRAPYSSRSTGLTIAPRYTRQPPNRSSTATAWSVLLQTIPVVWVIITATFFMIRFVPGGPFTAEKAVTPEIMRNLEAHYGLNKPLYRQYLDYCGSILRGDLGPSFKYPTRSVNEIIAEKLPVSVELGLWSLGVALCAGLPLGLIAAVKRNTWVDYLCSSASMIGICIPTFVMGPLLILIFAIHFGWFNASGWYGPVDRVLPSLTLGSVYAAYVARLTRGGMLEVLSQDYIRTARAKGASEVRVLLKHALRGGLPRSCPFLARQSRGSSPARSSSRRSSRSPGSAVSS